MLQEISRLHQSVRELNQDIGKGSLAKDIGTASLNMAAFAAIMGLFHQLNEQAQQECSPQLKKIERKMATSDRILNFLRSGSTDVDPRIQKILRKIMRIQLPAPNAPWDSVAIVRDKLDKYTRKLNSFPDSHANQLTRFQTDICRKEIDRCRQALFDLEPQPNFFRVVPLNLREYYGAHSKL